MARRKDHTRDELKALCLQAARDIIHQQGFAAFSTREVARRIGYTVGTVHNVFGGYDDFILALNAQTLDAWQAYLEGRLKAAEPAQALLAVALGYLQFSQENYAVWSVLFDYHFTTQRDLPPWYQQKVQAIFALVEKAIAPYLGADMEAARHEARLLWSSVHGVTVLSLSNRLSISGAAPAEKLIADVVARALHFYQEK